MGKRVIVAVVLVPVLLAVLFLAPDWGLPIAISALAMVALHEVLWSTGFVKNPKVSGLAIVLAGLIPFWVFVGERMLPGVGDTFYLCISPLCGGHDQPLHGDNGENGGLFLPVYYDPLFPVDLHPAAGNARLELLYPPAFCSGLAQRCVCPFWRDAFRQTQAGAGALP